MRKLYLLIILIFCSISVFAQTKISGKVYDLESNEPLIGATILVQNTNQGTISDIDGLFTIELKGNNQNRLIVSFVGYEPVEVEVSESSTLSIPLKNAYRLDEVVIQAIRGTQSGPVTKHVIKKKQIERVYVGQDALFVLEKLSPSLISYTESGTNISNYGQMRLRGIDQSRINITFNGTPLNDMIDQGVFFSNFTDFTNSAETIQVERGVGTSTNGAAAYAGSVDFQSIDLRKTELGAELQFTTGSFGTYRASAELTTGLLDNKMAFYTRFSSIHSDGYRYHSSTDAYSFFFSGGYYGEKDMVTLTAFTGQTKNGLAYLPTSISDIEEDPRTNYVNENDIDNFGQDFLQLQYTRTIAKNSSLVATLYYGAAGGDFPAGFFVSDSIYSSTEPDGYYLTDRLVQVNYPLYNDHVGFISYFSHHSTDHKLTLNTGIHLYTFKRQNIESIIPDNANPYYDERSWKNEFSLFAKAEYNFGRVSLLGDIQVRTLSLTINPDDYLLPDEPSIVKDWTFINPKIGLTYFIDATKDLYFFYGYSGREPTKVDILGGFQLNSSNLESVKSDDVKAEYVNDFEGGFRIHNAIFQGQINAFYMRFTNEIAPIGIYVPEGFIQLRKNIPSSYRAGIELDWSWNILSFLSFNGNFTFMESRIEEYAPEEDPEIYTNVSQPFSPNFMGMGALVYHFKKIVDIEISGRFISESYMEPTNQAGMVLPSFFVSNMRLGVNFYKEHRVDFHFNNLFNTQYFTYGAPVDPDYDGINEPGYFIEPPRNFFIQLLLKF